MKRMSALLASLLLLLTGCSTGTDEPQKTPFRLDLFADKPKLVMAVENDLKAESSTAIDVFARKIETLSGGNLGIEIVYCDDPVERFYDKKADLVYASAPEFSGKTDLMKMFSGSFYFRDYTHMTMTLNSKNFYDATATVFSQELDGIVLHGVYRDASVILSIKDYVNSLTAFSKLEIGLREGELNNFIMEGFGVQSQYATQEALIEGFSQGEIANIECKISELDRVQKLFSDDFFYISPTWHDISINWLLVNEGVYQEQTKEMQSVIKEAAAFLIATEEVPRLTFYEAQLDRLIVNGGEVVALQIDPLRKKTKDILTANKAYTDGWNWELFDSVQSIIR